MPSRSVLLKKTNVVKTAGQGRKKSFSGFTVSLNTESKSKKRLSNHLQIAIETEPVTISQRLTIRDAQALRKWLNDELGNETSAGA